MYILHKLNQTGMIQTCEYVIIPYGVSTLSYVTIKQRQLSVFILLMLQIKLLQPLDRWEKKSIVDIRDLCYIQS